jgi:hypothetical protein
MKKIIFLLTVLLFAGFPLLAQFGAHAGVAFSSDKIKADGNSIDMSDKTVFTGGLFYRKALSEKFSFQPEINFLPRRGVVEMGMSYDEFEFGIKQDYTLNYLEVPLYFLYTGEKTQGFYAGVGPSFNFGMSGNVKYEMRGFDEGDISGEEDINFGKGEIMKTMYIGINGLIGYQFGSGLTVNGFINKSITETTNEIDEQSVGKFNMFSYGVRVGYLFNLQKEKAGSGLKTVF